MPVMSGLQILDVPPGPALAQLAAELSNERWPVLLAGGQDSGELNRWRFLAWDPVEVVEHRVTGRYESDPAARALPRLATALTRVFGAASEAEAEKRAWTGPALPPFCGGAVGLLGFDLGRELEALPDLVPPDAPLPDLSMGLYPFVLAEEVPTGRRMLVGRGSAGEARTRLDDVAALVRHASPVQGPAHDAVGTPCSTFERVEYESAVRRILDHIRQGDIYQVNLSQRFELPYRDTATALFEAVSVRNPVPFGSLFRTPDWQLLSNSPELFLRRRGNVFESRPIKGTRPRSGDPERDALQRAELEASEKELAELAMIVDLVRNDLGRSAELGSVSVDLPFQTDAWATVFHRLARVHGTLSEGLELTSILEGAYPPASVTGTPKIRALEIIEAIEPVRRHAYTGAFGWIDGSGDCDLSVNIRIATLHDERLLVPVGGGITVGSDPTAEYVETLHKARAMFDALHVSLPMGSLVA